MSTFPEPIPPIASIPVPTTLIDSLGTPTLTSTINAAVFPTSSTVTDSRGSAISTASYNVTVPISPPPTLLPTPVFRTTSWTTYMTVNGSTVPAIGGRVDVLTTVSKTYVFGPSTTLPLSVYSSISAESARSIQTSLPSDPPSSKSYSASTRRVTIIAAVIGCLVGIALVTVLVLVVLAKYRRRQRCAPDYAERQSSMWGSRLGARSSSRGDSTLDLNREPEPNASFVEPWTEQERPPQTSRKMQREMEQHTAGLVVTGPILGAGPSGEHAYNSVWHGKRANRLRSEPEPGRPVWILPVVRTPQELADPAPPVVSVPPITQSVPLPAPSQLQPDTQVARSGSERAGDTVIPPRYNEAWNIRNPPSV
ncbi:hypothetical protein RhiJN_12248 [Ceratobasidium sp. AG-Ba]|nr:hypothetical protein RhiJN_12248 [Ceratobasidium sp. AG-Ba]